MNDPRNMNIGEEEDEFEVEVPLIKPVEREEPAQPRREREPERERVPVGPKVSITMYEDELYG